MAAVLGRATHGARAPFLAREGLGQGHPATVSCSHEERELGLSLELEVPLGENNWPQLNSSFCFPDATSVLQTWKQHVWELYLIPTVQGHVIPAHPWSGTEYPPKREKEGNVGRWRLQACE